jgi:hypothetical protein
MMTTLEFSSGIFRYPEGIWDVYTPEKPLPLWSWEDSGQWVVRKG